MKEFNENPFGKDTPVTPFSNGSEYDYWHDHNCSECIMYESESKTEDDAKCKLAFHLDYGTISGEIPLWVAKEIGCKYNPLYQTCRLYQKCKCKNTGELLW